MKKGVLVFVLILFFGGLVVGVTCAKDVSYTSSQTGWKTASLLGDVYSCLSYYGTAGADYAPSTGCSVNSYDNNEHPAGWCNPKKGICSRNVNNLDAFCKAQTGDSDAFFSSGVIECSDSPGDCEFFTTISCAYNCLPPCVPATCAANFSLPRCYDGGSGCGSSLVCNMGLSNTECVDEVIAPDNSLVLDYSFDDDFSGGTVIDSSNYHNDGVVVDAIYSSTGGHGGTGGVVFDGVGDYINVSGLNLQSFTFSAWVKVDNSVNLAEESYLLNKQDGSTWHGGGFAVSMFNSGSSGMIGVGTSGVDYAHEEFPSEYVADKWYHIVVVMNSSGPGPRGPVDAYRDLAISTYNPSDADLVSSNAQIPLRIGMNQTGYGIDFKGVMDDIKIWNRSFTQTEVESLLNSSLKCEDGFANCNGDWSDGCEIELGTDTNCGSCNDDCTVGGETCVSGVCTGGDEVYWMNLMGELITHANKDDYVRLFSTELPPYDISENGDTIVTVSNALWQVNQTPTVGFNFSSNGLGINETHYLLTAGDGNDDPMKLSIEFPGCGLYNLTDQIKYIRIHANDSDDYITGNVTIGSDVRYFDNLNGYEIDIPYIFNTSGNIQIVAFANNSDGEVQKVTSNIMIVNSSGSDTQYYVASCIDKPTNFKKFTRARVEFDASSSKGIKFTKADQKFEVIPPSRLFFNWTFYQGATSSYGVSCVGRGTAKCPGDTSASASVYHFWRSFPTVDRNFAFLSVSIPDDEMD